MSAPSSDRAAIRQTYRLLKETGHTIVGVDDHGPDEDLVEVTTEAEVIDAIMAVDYAHLHVRLPDGKSGHVFFVLGNDPEEVINDHTENLGPVLDPMMDRWNS